MPRTIVIVGFGPGISTSVAERFGATGFAVALVARRAASLAAGVQALTAKGITADGFAADAGDPRSIRAAIVKARAALGPVGVLHWNAYGGGGLGDLLTVDPATASTLLDVALVGLLSAVQETFEDLKADGKGAVLVTNGAFGELNPSIDALALAVGAVGVSIANAAKAKAVGLLSARLKNEGIFLGEVTVAGVVKGTGPDAPGLPTIKAEDVAEAFWRLYETRDPVRIRLG
jgi:NADP-dependent 3-hydroxy acid dehydrogenase YdfG